MSLCCVNCFKDDYIREKIVEHRTIGTCMYCKSESVNVVETSMLSADFERLFDIYDRSEKGAHWDTHAPYDIGELAEVFILSDLKPFHKHIQDDWLIFSDSLPENRRIELVSNICNTETSYEWGESKDVATVECAIFYDNIVTNENNPSLWEDFCEEIKHSNRFIFDYSPVKEFISFLHTKRNIVRKGKEFYRARIGHEVKESIPTPLSAQNLGKPPTGSASEGRANPRGISYLYTSSDVDTAVSEVRPWKTAFVSVATYNIEEDLEIIDLTMSKVESPFQTDDLRGVAQAQKLLETISLEFSKPVSPYESGIDYLPTQYLAELIKSNGFKGFKFKSSISDGDNFVFFSEKNFNVTNTSLHRVDNITISQSLV